MQDSGVKITSFSGRGVWAKNVEGEITLRKVYDVCLCLYAEGKNEDQIRIYNTTTFEVSSSFWCNPGHFCAGFYVQVCWTFLKTSKQCLFFYILLLYYVLFHHIKHIMQYTVPLSVPWVISINYKFLSNIWVYFSSWS